MSEPLGDLPLTPHVMPMSPVSGTAPFGSFLQADIGKLAEALAKAQANFKAVAKDRRAVINSTKGNYTYAYADLASILEAVRKPLADQGLAVVQVMSWEGAHAWLITRLLHSSGQSIESHYPLKDYERPQEFGSALTYARRYSLTALVGIAAEEDDDGQAAGAGTPRPETTARRDPPPAAKAPTPGVPKVAMCPNCKHVASVMKHPDPYKGTWLCNTERGGCGFAFL